MAVKWRRESLEVAEDGAKHVSHFVFVDEWQSTPDVDDTRWKVGRVIDLFTLHQQTPVDFFFLLFCCLVDTIHLDQAHSALLSNRRERYTLLGGWNLAVKTDQVFRETLCKQTDKLSHKWGVTIGLLWVNCNYLLACLSLRPFLLLFLLLGLQ